MKEKAELPTLDGFTWEMKNYIQGVQHQCDSPTLTQYAAEHMFQLDPPPPEFEEPSTANDYILEALKQKNLDYFSFFLHKNEIYLNRLIRRTLAGDADIRYDPELFLDIKLSCVLTMLLALPKYDPSRGTAFRTYVHYYVKNTIRQYQRRCIHRCGTTAGPLKPDTLTAENSHPFRWPDSWKNWRGDRHDVSPHAVCFIP